LDVYSDWTTDSRIISITEVIIVERIIVSNYSSFE